MVSEEIQNEENNPGNAWEKAQNALKEVAAHNNPKTNNLNNGFSTPYSNGVLGNGYMYNNYNHQQRFTNGPPPPGPHGNWYNQPPPGYQNRSVNNYVILNLFCFNFETNYSKI